MRTLFILLAGTVLSFNAFAGDWPCFGGADRGGVSAETGLVDAFGDKGPPELWKLDMNGGFGGAALFDGKVYIMDRQGNSKTEGTDFLLCLDLVSGKKLWSESYEAPGGTGYKGARATPAVDKDVVVTVGAMGNVVCWDRQKHTALWKHHLIKDFNGALPTHCVSQSALILGDLVIVAPQSKTVGVVAYEKMTGKVKWQSKGIGQMMYQSPLLVTIDKVPQIVMACYDGVSGLDPASGEILWKYDKWRCDGPIATPTDLGDGRFFVTGAYNGGCAMFKVSPEGGKWSVKEQFKNHDVESHIHNVLYYDKHLYANSTANGKGLVCLTPDGKIVWQSMKDKKGVGFDIGGPLLIADKKIFIVDGASGILYLLQASPDGYKELCKAQVMTGRGIVTWAPMALSDGKLVIRDQKTLKCLDVKAKK